MSAAPKFITLYRVVGYNSADWGGSHCVVFSAYSRSRAGALLLGKGKDSWGSDCTKVQEVKGIEIGNKIYMVEGPLDVDEERKKTQEKLRQEALAKLSEEEKEALGLK